jgi:hypothetical protein
MKSNRETGDEPPALFDRLPANECVTRSRELSQSAEEDQVKSPAARRTRSSRSVS